MELEGGLAAALTVIIGGTAASAITGALKAWWPAIEGPKTLLVLLAVSVVLNIAVALALGENLAVYAIVALATWTAAPGVRRIAMETGVIERPPLMEVIEPYVAPRE